MSFDIKAGTGICLAALVLLLGSVAPAGVADGADRTTIRGALAYSERIALPEGADAVAVVELRDARVAGGPLVAERRIPLRGKDVPIAFELSVARRVLLPGVPYAVHGTILVDGHPEWVSEAKIVEAWASVVDLGTLSLTPYKAAPLVWTMRCGDEIITIAFQEGQARLQVGGERICVPARAVCSIEHERKGVHEEIEFQIKWTHS